MFSILYASETGILNDKKTRYIFVVKLPFPPRSEIRRNFLFKLFSPCLFQEGFCPFLFGPRAGPPHSRSSARRVDINFFSLLSFWIHATDFAEKEEELEI